MATHTRGFFTRRCVALAIATTGGLLLAGCGGGDSDGGDGNGGDAPDNALTELWQSEPTPGANEDGVASTALWATESTVAEVTDGGVRSLDAAGGEVRWELTAPSGVGEVCAVSPTTNAEGIGAVMYNAAPGEDSCGILAVVDSDAEGAEPLWTQDLTPEDGLISFVGVTVADDVVSVSLGGKDMHQFTVAGEELPPPTVPGGTDCQDGARWAAGGNYLVAVAQCDIFEEVYQFTAFDAASRSELWTLPEMPLEYEGVAEVIPGGEHLTVLTTAGQLVTFDENGEVLSEIVEEVEGGEIDLMFGPQWASVQGQVMFAFELASDDRLGFDLTTGSELWREAFPAPTTLGGGDGRVLAVYGEEAGAEAEWYQHVAALDPQEGAQTLVGVLPRIEGASFTSPSTLSVLGSTLYVTYEVEGETGEVTMRTAAYELPA
ncbi:outer membrane protein assembly factor BamB family protein [Streptomyces litchfieldiae]|uniref:PQQ-binding-like beta-propeller repeat protein n=1 Tax=Streptomyces litchfieldiae TaxID=3075543 RepID=A0ABU2MNV1_9ACTN|nr:PQQ-binding-like beta-propeller repeat protein [Streptomyces sp. DSM 44938]MDT0343297.1 PQQ-binding-like beta-propeller repeat protein [Streptomyces sp. DSM 44938]